MAGAARNCSAAISARSVYAIQPCNMSRHFMQSHVRSLVYTCLGVTSHLHFWQNDRDLFTCYCGNTGVERIPKYELAQKVEQKLSRRSCQDSNPRLFDHESGALTTELSPPPKHDFNRNISTHVHFFHDHPVRCSFATLSCTGQVRYDINGKPLSENKMSVLVL